MVEDEVDIVSLTVPVSFILKGREIPFVTPLVIAFEKEDLPVDKEDLTDMDTSFIIDKMNQKNLLHMVFEDFENNKRVVMIDEIQAYTILTPEHYDPAEYVDNED